MSMKTPPSKRQSSRDPSAMLSRMTWMQVAMGRQFGNDDEKITADVREAIRNAVENRGPYLKTVDVDGKPEKCVNMSGMFRMAVNEFNLDDANQFERDVWTGVVERALADSLAHKGSFGSEGFEQREAI